MSEQAGREMDARVAWEVMGWKLFRVGYRGTDDETPEQTLYKKEFERAGFEAVGWYAWTGEKVILWEDDFTEENCYSTSIAAAWEVVTALERKSLFLTLSRNQIPNDANGQQSKWDVLLWDNGKQVAHIATADTAPLAICLAVLKAVGAEGEGR